MNLRLRGTILLIILLLLGTTLSACGSFSDGSFSDGSSTTPSATSTQSSLPSTETTAEAACVMDATEAFGKAILAGLTRDDEFLPDASDGQDCVKAISDYLSQQLNSNNLQAVINQQLGQLKISVVPQVAVGQLSDSTFSYTYDSQTYSNCTDNPSTQTVSYGIPVSLVLGTLDANQQLQPMLTYLEIEPLPYISNDTTSNSNPHLVFPRKGGLFLALTDAQWIAQKLYYYYDLPNYFNHNESFTLTLQPHQNVQLHLPLTINYQSGWGMAERNGQAGQLMAWYYNYNFQPNFDPDHLAPQQMTETTC